MKTRFFKAKLKDQDDFDYYFQEMGSDKFKDYNTPSKEFGADDFDEIRDVTYTWQDLKDFCNNLPQEQLSEPVRVLGEGTNEAVENAVVFKDDMICPDDYIEPVSSYDDSGYDMTDEPIVFPKGYPIIYIK